MFNCFLSHFVSVQVSDAYVNILSIIVFFSLNFSFFDMFLANRTMVVGNVNSWAYIFLSAAISLSI